MALSTRQFPELDSPLGEGETLPQGTVLQKRYEILKIVNIGGMGVIYQARDLRFPKVTRLCAVKEMINAAPDIRLRELTVQAFEREANVMAMLDHPALPKIFDYFSEGNRSYLVMEFISGKDLGEVLEETPGFLPEEKVIEWAISVCDMLHYLHTLKPQPVIFRDIKPDNIMLTPQERVVLVDFGIAKVFQPDQKGTMIGTEGYSPPEQYRGIAEPRGDVYALGATVHHLLTKRNPTLEPPFSFEERPVRSINPDVSEGLEAIVMKALQYDMDKRFSSAVEMKLALRALNELQTGGTCGEAVGTIALARSSDSVLAVWQFACEDEVRSSPVVSDGVLYVGAYDHNLWALDAKSGEFAWKYATEGGVAATPCVYEGKVIVGSEDRVLYAVSADQGRIVWSCPTNGRIRCSARVEFGHVFFGSDDGYLYTVRAQSGRVAWRFQAMKEIRSTPAVEDEVVYFGSEDGHLYALSMQGSLRWRFRIARGVMSSPLVFEGLVYVGGRDNSLYAIDARYGSAAWRYRTGGQVLSSPAVSPELGIVYVGSVDGSVYAVDADSGRLVWKFSTEDQVNSSPAVYEGGVYIGSRDGHLYALDGKSGDLRWKFKTEGKVFSSPVVHEGMVYIGSTDRRVYALPV